MMQETTVTSSLRSQGAEVTTLGVRYRTWTSHEPPEVVIVSPSGSVSRSLKLEAEEGGFCSVIDPEGKAGDLYQYRIGGNLFPDPASCFQPVGVHGPSQV